VIKHLADQYGADQLVLVFGLNELGNLRIMATTFRDGDPSFAGVLGGVALGLKSYHIFELKDEIPADVWEKEMGFKELEVEDALIARICALMRGIREG
jgi:betaine reductase